MPTGNKSDVIGRELLGELAPILRQAGDENFPVASMLLPRRHRAHLLALYGFARLVDDVGDEAPPGDRLRLLDQVEADVDRIWNGTPRIPAVRALAGTVAACGLPAEPLRKLIEANRRDQSVTRYDTFDDLLGYCALSADPVGHLVLGIFGAATPLRVKRSDMICSALQVIEHCQDVGEDYARGRIYLPQQDLKRFGCGEADLAGPDTPTRLRGVIALQARRAGRMLATGAPLVTTLPGFARVAVAGYAGGGLAALHSLDRAAYDVLGRPARPRRGRLVYEWLRLLARPAAPLNRKAGGGFRRTDDWPGRRRGAAGEGEVNNGRR